MKELIEKIAVYIPEYLITFGKLLSGPKTFLATTKPRTDQGFRNGLQFLAVSVVLFVVALTPRSPEGSDIWRRLAAVSVSELLGVAVGAGIIRLAWRLVGGKADTRSIFTLYCYTSSVVVLFIALTLLISDGTVKVFNPSLYASVREAQRMGKPIPSEVVSSTAFIASSFILVGGFVALAAWGFATWGAFRALNVSTRIRSFGALFLAGLLSWPLGFVLFVVGRALSP